MAFLTCNRPPSLLPTLDLMANKDKVCKQKCVTATLNHPTQLNEQPVFPHRIFSDVPKFPTPRNSTIIRILLGLTVLICMILQATEVTELILTYDSLWSWYLLLELCAIVHSLGSDVKERETYEYFIAVQAFLFFVLSLSTFGLFIANFSSGKLHICLTTAYIVVIVDQWFHWNRRFDYYSKKTKEQETVMINTFMDSLRHTVVFGQPFVDHFMLLTSAVTHDVVWAGFSDAMKAKLTLPSDLYWQNDHRRTFYYVPWASYYSVNDSIKEKIPLMEELVGANSSLRNEMKRQARLLTQLRKKIHGSNVFCSDLQQIPVVPAALPIWNPDTANVIFVSMESTLSAFVNLYNYRKMVLYAVKLNDSIEVLKDESLQLNMLLQQRTAASNRLVKKVLEMTLIKKNTAAQVASRELDGGD